jgi:uncharacterized membrane protein YkoI
MDKIKQKYFKEYYKTKEKARKFHLQVAQGYFKEINLMTIVQNYVYEVQLELYADKLIGL